VKRILTIMVIALLGMLGMGWLWFHPDDVRRAGAVMPAETSVRRTDTAAASPVPEKPRLPGLPRNSLPTARPAPASPAMVVAFTRPSPGAVVASPVQVEARVSGVRLAPSGTSGGDVAHLHILVDPTDAPLKGVPLMRSPSNRGFDDGASAGDLELVPGAHRLVLVLTDGHHVPFDPPVISAVLPIMVTGIP